MIIRIFKAHIVECDFALRLSHFHSVCLIENFDVRIHDLQKPFNSCHAALELFRKLDNPADRRNQRRHIQKKRHQVACRDPSLYHKYAAEKQNRHIHCAIKSVGCRIKDRHQVIGISFDVKELSVVCLKLVRLHLFICKCLYNLLPQQAVLNAGV